MQRYIHWISVLTIVFGITAFCQNNAPTTPTLSTRQEKSSGLRSSPADEGSAIVGKNRIRRHAKVFVASMEDGFDNFVIAGLQKKQVPLIVVTDRDKADYEISGVAESEKAGWAKMLFLSSEQSKEQASIKVTDLKTNEIVFAYSVHKSNSVHGRQSTGEACAKHIKEVVASE